MSRERLAKCVAVIAAAVFVAGISGCARSGEQQAVTAAALPTEPTPVTIDEVATFIEEQVAAESQAEGAFLIFDDVAGQELRLSLDKVHRERLSETAPNTYFVCADFVTPEGKTYDLDFWVKNTPAGLEVTETMVHKEEGAPRYTWIEKDGTWTREPA